MRVTTWNVNGLRAAERKGLLDFVERIAPDVLLLQEVRCNEDQLPKSCVAPPGYRVHWHPAEKKGYAGVAVWSKHPFEILGTGMDDADPDGRILRVRVEGVQLASVYLPSGSSGPERQSAKDAWMERFLPWARELLRTAREPVILGGDLNIAHTEDDIHNAKANEKSSGFLPHEREWFTRLLEVGYTDLFRRHVGPSKGPYSWWSNRGRARELDRGWRIDYLLGNEEATARLVGADILREGGLVISDHAPVTVDLR